VPSSLLAGPAALTAPSAPSAVSTRGAPPSESKKPLLSVLSPTWGLGTLELGVPGVVPWPLSSLAVLMSSTFSMSKVFTSSMPSIASTEPQAQRRKYAVLHGH
jgi:hypothetical protein